jgi:putative PIN family toxin of toxin-antitoxin system
LRDTNVDSEMLAVVDTNVWVSAFLTPAGASAKLLDAVRRGQLVPAYSNAIESEYREVLSRPRFRLGPELVAEFFERLHEVGRHVEHSSPVAFALPDPDDAPFIALARHLNCPIVTGNARHFPLEVNIDVCSPAEFLARIDTADQ